MNFHDICQIRFSRKLERQLIPSGERAKVPKMYLSSLQFFYGTAHAQNVKTIWLTAVMRSGKLSSKAHFDVFTVNLYSSSQKSS